MPLTRTVTIGGLALALTLPLAGCGSRGPRQQTVIAAPEPQEIAGTPAEALVRLGDSMRASGDPDGAAQFYEAAVARDGRSVLALDKLGDALLAAGDGPRAEAAFRAARVLSPGDRDAGVGLGIALLARGDAAGALPLLEPAARSSRDARVLRNYGVALDMTGRQAEAQAAYRRGLAEFPANPDLHANLALSLAIGGDVAGAEREIDAAANLPNASDRVRANRVMLLAMAGRDVDAREAGRQLAEPGRIDALVAQGSRARAAAGPAGRAAALGTVMAPGPATP